MHLQSTREKDDVRDVPASCIVSERFVHRGVMGGFKP
jgi:hypothetical protein